MDLYQVMGISRSSFMIMDDDACIGAHTSKYVSNHIGRTVKTGNKNGNTETPQINIW